MARVDDHSSFEIMQRAQTSKPTLWHWQQRYLGEGVAGLKRNKARPSRAPPSPRETGLKVMAKTVRASSGARRDHYGRRYCWTAMRAPPRRPVFMRSIRRRSTIASLATYRQSRGTSGSVAPWVRCRCWLWRCRLRCRSDCAAAQSGHCNAQRDGNLCRSRGLG